MSHKVVKSVSPEHWVKSTWFQAVGTKLTAEWHVEIPWLNGACLPTRLLPAVKKGHIAAFPGVPCRSDLLIPACPAATTGRLWLRLCSSCAPCPWVMGVDFLTALHLALKFPSLGLCTGTDSNLTQYLRMAVIPSAASVGWQQSLSGFWQVAYSCAHTKPLLPTNTCYLKRSPLKSDASTWVRFASFHPWKIKAIFFPQRKKIFCDLLVYRKIHLWIFIPGSMLTRPQNSLWACETNKSLSSVDKVYQSILKETFLPLNVLDTGYCQ